MSQAKSDPGHVMTVRALGVIARLGFWILLLLLTLDNLGFNITSLVAGLGVGGVAVALAVQNILGDLFSSLTIVLDKPFVIGDDIVIDGFSGKVEKIGLKTTRIRSISGEQLVFGNGDLLSSRIRNFQKLERRRVTLTLGVVYQTEYAQLTAIPKLVEDIIAAIPDLTFERAHFKSYGPSSLDFEIVYWVMGAEYKLFMDKQQAVNLEIFKAFSDRKIEFAYPTQTIELGATLQKGPLGAGYLKPQST